MPSSLIMGFLLLGPWPGSFLAGCAAAYKRSWAQNYILGWKHSGSFCILASDSFRRTQWQVHNVQMENGTYLPLFLIIILEQSQTQSKPFFSWHLLLTAVLPLAVRMICLQYYAVGSSVSLWHPLIQTFSHHEWTPRQWNFIYAATHWSVVLLPGYRHLSVKTNVKLVSFYQFYPSVSTALCHGQTRHSSVKTNVKLVSFRSTPNIMESPDDELLLVRNHHLFPENFTVLSTCANAMTQLQWSIAARAALQTLNQETNRSGRRWSQV